MTEHHAGNCTDPYCPRHGDLYVGDPDRIKREPSPRLAPTKEKKMARTTTVHQCASGAEYAPGSFESCIRCNPPTDEQLKNELAYYFDHEPTKDDIEAYREWRLENLETDTAEYVEAVQAL